MHRICAFFFFTFWSIAAIAEPAFVQSGEHANFSRLVTPVANPGAWRVEQDGKRAALSIENYAGGFDISQVFEMIPRGRVQRIEADQNTLTLYLGCDCTIEAFDVAGGYVALDIISSDERETNFVQTTRSPHPEIVVKPPPPKRLPLKAADSPLLRSITSSAEHAIMTDIQARLSRELGRGITQGVLQPNQPLPPPLRRAQIDTSTFQQPTANVRLDRVRQAANMRITTSMDVVKRPDASEQSFSEQGFWCPPDDATDVASWGDDRSFDIQISEARRDLFGEFDRLNPDAAVILAKTYLYFGFGVEARQVLSLDPEVAREEQLLIDIADIMETSGSAPDLSIASYTDCTGNISLWSFLANGEKQPSSSVNASTRLLALNQLPTHLRQHVAPVLSAQFLALGDQTSAATALRSLERLPNEMPPAVAMAQANIGLADGNFKNGAQTLQDVAAANAAQSPEALIRLVDAKINSGETISPETAGLVEAYAQELRETDLGPPLRRAHVLALIETQSFDQALNEINLLDGLNVDVSATQLRTVLMAKLTATASDITFLNTVFQQPPETLTLLGTDLKIRLAARLLDLGFDERSHDIIDGVPDQPFNQDRQMLAARIALALGQPYQALAELLNTDESEAEILRAQAKSMVGAHQEAHALYKNADRQDAALRSGLLAENWQDLISADTPVFGQAAALATSGIEPAADQGGMLNRTTVALNESKDARQIMNDFLAASELQVITE